LSRPEKNQTSHAMKNFNLILLVEDNEIDQYINQVIIERVGLAQNIIQCENGVQALDLVRKIYPDLILLDISMPVMDGLEFLQALREEELQETPVVILSCSNNKWDIEQVAQYNVKYYLVKPLTEEKLAKMIERCF
jgi:CheY-like chemotaxis protein